MRKSIYTLIVVVASFAVFTASVSAIPQTDPQSKRHSVTLRVGDTAKWQSKRLGDVAIGVEVYYRGKSLDADEVSSCVFDYAGRGFIVRLSACGGNAPLRVRAANVSSKPVKVRVVYWRADQ